MAEVAAEDVVEATEEEAIGPGNGPAKCRAPSQRWLGRSRSRRTTSSCWSGGRQTIATSAFSCCCWHFAHRATSTTSYCSIGWRATTTSSTTSSSIGRPAAASGAVGPSFTFSPAFGPAGPPPEDLGRMVAAAAADPAALGFEPAALAYLQNWAVWAQTVGAGTLAQPGIPPPPPPPMPPVGLIPMPSSSPPSSSSSSSQQ
ncbi:hypothetical protein TYRP_023086 [Tyrophagus putrescentiae]|nr:hypothetical protein TYRP_023086 [Tyrophagus putrescentiae]